MKRIVLLLLLVLVSINYQSCKVLKKVHRDKSIVSSSLDSKQEADVSKTEISDNERHHEADWLKIIQSTSVKAKKIIYSEEDMPTNETSFVFRIDSLNPYIDTLRSRAKNGTELEIYTDKKTGQLKANMRSKGGKKKTVEIDGFSLDKGKAIDSGRSATNQINHTLVKKDSTGNQKVKAAAQIKTETVEKDVKKDFGLLKWIGATAVGIILLFVFYKLNQAKKWFKLPFGNKGQ